MEVSISSNIIDRVQGQDLILAYIKDSVLGVYVARRVAEQDKVGLHA